MKAPVSNIRAVDVTDLKELAPIVNTSLSIGDNLLRQR